MVKYALAEPPGPVQSSVLSSPNDALEVRKDGIYRLLEVQYPLTLLKSEV